ncbi:MAG: hypothetical protein WCW16_02835 [Candidatus Magasanikbacteria bacterium]
MFKKTLVFAGVLAFIFTASGCGQKTLVENQMERQLEKNLGGDAKVQVDGENVNIQTQQGSLQVGENVSLPQDFPSDVYVIDGQLMSAMKNVAGAGFQVVVKSDKSVKDAQELYENKLKEQGWTITASMDLGTASVVSAKKDERVVTVSIGTEEGKKELTVIITIVDNSIQMPN